MGKFCKVCERRKEYGKNKFIAVTREREARDTGQNIGKYNIQVVDEFIYLGALINPKNDVTEVMKIRILFTNRCYFGLSKYLRK